MDEHKSTEQKVINRLEDTFAEPLGDILRSAGKLGSIFVLMAVTLALVRIFIPDLDKDLTSFVQTVPFIASWRPASLISLTILLFLLLFFVVVVFNAVFVPVILTLAKVMRGILNALVNNLAKLLFTHKQVRLAKQLSKLIFFFKKNVFLQDSWVAKSSGSWVNLTVPFSVENFVSAKCKIKPINTKDGYWRAGVYFETGDGQYVFHLYINRKGDQLKTRIVWLIPGVEEKKDSNKSVNAVFDPGDVNIGLSRRDKTVFLSVNNIEIDKFNVPFSNDTRLLFAAWGDGRNLEVEFSDIEVLA